MDTSHSPATPFGSEPIDEVPLPRSPLLYALVQIRFPPQSALVHEGDAVARELARRLRPRYPVFDMPERLGAILTAEGITPTQEGARGWRFSAADRSGEIALTSSFLTLLIARYAGRDDLCARFGEAWNIFCEVAGRPAAVRIGFRYINRVDDRTFLADRLQAMVRPEVLGATLATGPAASTIQSLAENDYRHPGGKLTARWGVLAPGQTYDPFTLGVHPRTSWVLDIECFREFEPPAALSAEVPELTRELSLAAYRFFRWAVTPEFLRFFGGDA